MKNVWTFLIIFLVLVFILAMTLIFLVRDTALRAIDPILRGNEQLSTQVADFLHPTPTILPDPVTIIHQVRSLARLETIQYSVEKIITADSGQDILRPLFGDKLLFVAHGTVIAGVDLNKLNSSDLKLEDNVLKVRLPAPEVFTATLDNEKSYVFNRETGVLTKGNPDLETQARRVAEQEILKAALADGILPQARTNAEAYLVRLLNDLGFKNVIFIAPTATPAPTLTLTPAKP
jgi:hypothetical protein